MDNKHPDVFGADKSKLKYKFPEFNVNAPENISSDLDVKDQELTVMTGIIQIPKSVSSGYDYIPYDEYGTAHQSSMKLRHHLSVQLGLEYNALPEIEIPENKDNEIAKEVEQLVDDYYNGKTEVRAKILKAVNIHLFSDSEDCEDDAGNSDDEDQKSEDEDQKSEDEDQKYEDEDQKSEDEDQKFEDVFIIQEAEIVADELMDLDSESNSPAITDNEDSIECIDLVSDYEQMED